MAGKLSIRQANLILNSEFRGVPHTLPTELWAALFTAGSDTPLRTNSLATAGEVSGAGYERVAIGGANPLVFTESTAAQTKVSGTVLWPTAESSWGVVTYVAIMDAATDGNVIIYGALQAPKTVDTGDTFRVPTDMLAITM